jgi:hypothetical protein
MNPDTLAPNGLPITETTPVDMPETLSVPFITAWVFTLVQAAQLKAMKPPPYRGYLPKLLGRRAQARAQGYTSHINMLRRQQEREDAMLRDLGHPV